MPNSTVVSRARSAAPSAVPMKKRMAHVKAGGGVSQGKKRRNAQPAEAQQAKRLRSRQEASSAASRDQQAPKALPEDTRCGKCKESFTSATLGCSLF